MTPSELRIVLRGEFEKFFRVDKWSIGLPDEIKDFNHPPSVGREKPVSEILAIERMLGRPHNTNFQVRERRNFDIVYRLPQTLTYEDVIQNYRNSFETTAIAFCAALQRQPPIGIIDIEPSASVFVRERSNGDWLLVLRTELVIVYESEGGCPVRFG